MDLSGTYHAEFVIKYKQELERDLDPQTYQIFYRNKRLANEVVQRPVHTFLNFPLKIKEHVKVASRSSSVNAFFNNTFAPFQLLKFCENQVLPSRSIAICFEVATFTNSKSELEEEILPLEQMKMEPITSS